MTRLTCAIVVLLSGCGSTHHTLGGVVDAGGAPSSETDTGGDRDSPAGSGDESLFGDPAVEVETDLAPGQDVPPSDGSDAAWELPGTVDAVAEAVLETASQPGCGKGPGCRYVVLFDASKGATAGNADWVIDDDAPEPSPASPSKETDWKGAYSAWAFDLWKSGEYVVRTIPPGSKITGDSQGFVFDLAHADVLVLPEPNNPLSKAEKEAILDFVSGGGGLFMIADHKGSDRDGDGWDAPRVLNDLLDQNPVQADPFGFRIANDSLNDAPDQNLLDDPTDPVLHGPFGDVEGVGYYAGSTLRITAKGDQAKALAWKTGAPHGTEGVTFVVSHFGAGRVACIGDSSPADDGTGAKGDNLYDSWSAAGGETNAILFLNATAWLASGN